MSSVAVTGRSGFPFRGIVEWKGPRGCPAVLLTLQTEGQGLRGCRVLWQEGQRWVQHEGVFLGRSPLSLPCSPGGQGQPWRVLGPCRAWTRGVAVPAL